MLGFERVNRAGRQIVVEARPTGLDQYVSDAVDRLVRAVVVGVALGIASAVLLALGAVYVVGH